MSEHFSEYLGAYLDGELHGRQFQKVKAHLAECPSCQEEYENLQALSAGLLEAALPEFTSVDRLAANVALRLPHKSNIPMHRKVLTISWWLVPVGLISAWIFISTAGLISNWITTASDLGLLNSTAAWLIPGTPVTISISDLLGQFGFLNQGDWQWLTVSESLTRTALSNVFWQVAIAGLYLCWLAIWWARHQQQGLGQSLES